MSKTIKFHPRLVLWFLTFPWSFNSRSATSNEEGWVRWAAPHNGPHSRSECHNRSDDWIWNLRFAHKSPGILWISGHVSRCVAALWHHLPTRCPILCWTGNCRAQIRSRVRVSLGMFQGNAQVLGASACLCLLLGLHCGTATSWDRGHCPHLCWLRGAAVWPTHRTRSDAKELEG